MGKQCEILCFGSWIKTNKMSVPITTIYLYSPYVYLQKYERKTWWYDDQCQKNKICKLLNF